MVNRARTGSRRKRVLMRRWAMLFNTLGSAGAVALLLVSLTVLVSLVNWFFADSSQTFLGIVNIALSVLFHPVGGANLPLSGG